MSAKTAHVEGGVIPAAACLCRVISAVFIHVQKPVIDGVGGGLMDARPSARTHRSVCLRNATSHTTDEPSSGRVHAHRSRGTLDLGSGEKEDGTLRRRLDPGLNSRPRHQRMDTQARQHSAPMG